MANKLQVQIQETVEELEHRLEGHATAANKEKLLVLYWLATKKIQKRAELATPVETRLFNNISLVKSLQTRWNYAHYLA